MALVLGVFSPRKLDRNRSERSAALNDELKSAVDLALEKLDREMGETIPKLSEDQKERIAEIRRKFQARIAETEISSQAEISKVVQAGASEGVIALEQKVAGEKRRLQASMEREISRVREE